MLSNARWPGGCCEMPDTADNWQQWAAPNGPEAAVRCVAQADSRAAFERSLSLNGLNTAVRCFQHQADEVQCGTNLNGLAAAVWQSGLAAGPQVQRCHAAGTHAFTDCDWQALCTEQWAQTCAPGCMYVAVGKGQSMLMGTVRL